VAFNDVAYVGVSSGEEVSALIIPNYQCCTFRGSEVALDVRTGRILWKTYAAPTGYSGNAIWGNTAAIDPPRGNVYVATGNNYSVPDAVRLCEQQGGTNCDAADNFVDSMLALDMRTGAVKWATGTIEFDEWTVACFGQTIPQPNCPSPDSPDADFGSGPNLFSAGGRTLVGAGTKAGTYWALDPTTGQIVWATQVGPGGIFGGIEFGSSVADGRVYVAIANSDHAPVTLTHPAPGSATTTSGGFWAALNGATGAILWQMADPAGPTFGALGTTTTANGVVYVGSTDAVGHVYGLDAATGQIKWAYATGGSVASGPAILNGTVYWGSGYIQFSAFGTTGNNRLFAFSVP
jgi:polyvinyl alcohol dehydrogenase (cytochrome)